MAKKKSASNPLQYVPALRHHDFFASCSEEQLATLAALCRLRCLDRKEELFRAGQTSDGFYLVLSGMMRLYRNVGGHHQKTVRFIPAGDAFAEATIFDSAPYPVSAAACMKSDILWVPGDAVVKMLQDSWTMTANVMKLFLVRLKSKVSKIGYLGFKEVKLRFAFFIMDQMEQQQDARIQNPEAISLNMPRKEIADHLATTPETVSRILKILRESGILVPTGRHLFRIHPDKLSKFIEGELEKQGAESESEDED